MPVGNPYPVPTHPWLRMRDEPEIAHRSFLVFRDIGPERSISEVNAILKGIKFDRKKKKKYANAATLEWSKKFKWYDRATRWDHYKQKMIDKVIIEDVKKWERRKLHALEDNWGLSERIQGRASEILDMPITQDVLFKDGRTIVRKPLKVGMADAMVMTKTALEIQAACFTAATKPLADRTPAEVEAIGSVFTEGVMEEIHQDDPDYAHLDDTPSVDRGADGPGPEGPGE